MIDKLARAAADVIGNLAGDLADATVEGVQKAEERVRRQRGDRVLRNFPRRVQLDDYSCGTQCAMSILEYFRFEYTASELKKALGTTKRSGTRDDRIIAFMREHGLKARRTSRVGPAWLDAAIRRGSPVLASVDGDHWIVIYGIGPERVYVSDPALTRARSVVAAWDEFRERLDGLAIAFGRR
jgi:ABC-type bacteriocin/lantibiotic exporter with double-glycine peptidase domain